MFPFPHVRNLPRFHIPLNIREKHEEEFRDRTYGSRTGTSKRQTCQQLQTNSSKKRKKKRRETNALHFPSRQTRRSKWRGCSSIVSARENTRGGLWRRFERNNSRFDTDFSLSLSLLLLPPPFSFLIKTTETATSSENVRAPPCWSAGRRGGEARVQGQFIVARAAQCDSLCRFEAWGINRISREGCRNPALFKIHACCVRVRFPECAFCRMWENVEHKCVGIVEI